MESEDSSTGTSNTNSNEANNCSTSNSTREDSTSTSSSESDTETQVLSNASKRKVLLSDDSDQEIKESARKTEITPSKSPALNKINSLDSSTSDDEDKAPVSKFKSHTSRIRQLSSSSSDDNDDNKVSPLKKTKLTDKDSNESPTMQISVTQTKISPLTTTTSSSSSSSTSDIETNIPTTSVRPQSERTLERGSKVKEKFKTIVKLLQAKNVGQKALEETCNPKNDSHNANSEACGSNADEGKTNLTREDREKSDDSGGSNSDTNDSDDDPSSINNIKKIIKKKHHAVKSTIYDPDTSDDEADNTSASQSYKRKQTKPTSPKPIRMSAKEAMDNMQKIKSESNRMLREKEVSLPYHRSKALTLKDIMSRRKPALTPDGKALPLKMNNEQLKQYAMLLEQRQKEMMELCKSDTDDEENDGDNVDQNKTNQTDVTNDQDSTDIQHDKGVDIVENINKSDKVAKAINSDRNIDEEIQDSDKTFDEMMLTNSNISKHDDNDRKVEELGSNNANNDEKDISVNIIKEAGTEMEVDEVMEENNSKKETVINETVQEDIVTPFDTEEITTAAHLTDKSTAKDDDSPILDNEASFSSKERNNTEKDSQLICLHFDSEKSNSDNVANENIEGVIEVNNDDLINELNSNIVQENNTEKNSQLISLCFDSERTNTEGFKEDTKMDSGSKDDDKRFSLKRDENQDNNGFSDDDGGFDDADIDNLIENADVIREKISIDSPMLIKEIQANSKPKITGQPGMLIDLDGTDPTQPRKCTGVELLKERFMYFSNLNTVERLERAREKKIIPGLQHLKLKQELEEQIAEQRSLEWTKRLEEEKQQKQELNAIIGDEDDDDELDKIEEKLQNDEKNEENEELDDDGAEDDESVEEPPENDVDMTDKPKKRNLMLDDEAEESECDDELQDDAAQNDEDDDDADSESSDSSDSEPEIEVRKKGRILKAFEDSDDENEKADINQTSVVTTESNASDDEDVVKNTSILDLNRSNQDEELQAGQMNKLSSEDLFASQDTPNDIQARSSSNSDKVARKNNINDSQIKLNNDSICLDVNSESNLGNKDKIDVICETQPLQNSNLDDIAAMCSGDFAQDPPIETQSQGEIGEDILELCTGKFYDNKFVTQHTPSQNHIEQDSESILKDEDCVASIIKENGVSTDKNKDDSKIKEIKKIEAESTILKSILDELDGPDFDAPKQKYFDSEVKNKENSQNVANSLGKKRYIIESDDEAENVTEEKTRRKKKRKLADRALQISDDEEDSEEVGDEESDIEDDDDEQTERVVEYDSEENEVVVLPQSKKKKRRMGEFFEQEAELTSEDEWVGSGDEDEAGLDLMEQEEGDKDQFHQGLLRRELEQIHMREVMDQDKREVRLLQELLFEDGDLGTGHRQRKFKWRNADGEEMTGTNPDQLADTPDEELESEEMWRKERHEREVFLRSLTQTEEESSPTVTLTRTAIIKANLTRSNTMSALLCEQTTLIETESTVLQKKQSKDVPSPVENGFPLQQYRGSILSRGRSTLERLAALATPIAGDGEGNKLGALPPSSKRNFVFATVSPVQDKNKVSKRKVEENPDTPKLLKKMKTEVKQNGSRSSLLEHFKV